MSTIWRAWIGSKSRAVRPRCRCELPSRLTPNLDRLAAQGMMFTDYYAEASCTAGRANFITGELPIRTGQTDSYKNSRQVHARHRPRRAKASRLSRELPRGQKLALTLRTPAQHFPSQSHSQTETRDLYFSRAATKCQWH
jgi:hypothetical protein